ncbi:MAG TPA: hypothetical protein VD689_04905 [Nitrosopumilaceae archaeon]|nr:hypothetical protein [Nitrosopumilaceae archaeon]
MIAKKILSAALLLVLVPVFAYAESGTTPVEVSGTIYNIVYDTNGVKINDITADYDFLSLLLEVEVTAPGLLEITFDRAYFDSTFDGSDEPFIVLADGEDISFAEKGKTEQTRTLVMELPSGTEEVEVIGTHLLEGIIGTATTEEPSVEEPEVIPEEEVLTEEEIPEETMTEEETPTEETPTMEEETSKCGLGTILKDGTCVLDERCGPGTHFEDGACVLDEKEPATEGVSLGGSNTSNLVIPAIIGFGIAFIVMIILWLIGRAGKSKQSTSSL